MRRLGALGLLLPAAIGFSATQARAAGETITLTQNDPTAVAGYATNFTASGTLNPDDTMFGFDIYVFAKDADHDPTCAGDFDTESAAASNSGGNELWASPPGGFQVGMGPSFDQPFKFTFAGSGHYLLCGYVQGDFSTFASGALRGVVGSPQPAVQRPAVVRAPWITRRGHVLTCHAGTWANKPTSRAYRWQVKGKSATLGSGQRLTVRKSLRGRKILCRVTAGNTAGATTVNTGWIRAR
jgi:hypothetical protein